MDFIKEEIMEQKRTTPEFITELQPGEIFVFGTRTELCHTDDAGRRGNHPSVCGRIHPVCQAASGTDVPRDSNWLRHSRIYG